MKIDVLTLFPEMFVPVTGSSILGRAAESGSGRDRAGYADGKRRGRVRALCEKRSAMHHAGK